MHVFVPKEIFPGERRVGLTPEGVKELIKAGNTAQIEPGAGAGSFFDDSAYEAAGATVSADISKAELILKVMPPTEAEIAKMKSGAAVVSFVYPFTNQNLIEAMRAHNITSFSMDLMPRISRAQSMDALSSMSTIAGYRASLLCATHLPSFFPMFMTAAGTLPPARAFILGAGVAGLQAIATCKRLGAIVEAFDVRPAVKEQIESLGAKFVGLSLVTGEGEGEGGYAKELSEDTHKKELELIAGRVKNVDCIITTALIPGKPAPLLITKEMVASMKPGSVIVDLAAIAGGNCECTKPGETVVVNGVTIIGVTDMIAAMASDASKMYSKNITAFLAVLMKEAKINLDMEDEVIRGTLVTHEGKVVHEIAQKAMAAAGGKA